MKVVCLDLEGVLVPEIWEQFADAVKIPELKKTTRDEPDYNALMAYRLNILKENNFKLSDVQKVIETLEPFEGASNFLAQLREQAQVIILSDTFSQFARPLMEKLNWPTIFCNELVVDENDEIVSYKMRCSNKIVTINALQSCGFETIASGDSLNDLLMIQGSSAGFLFRTTDEIKSSYPQIKALDTYEELLENIVNAL